MRSATLKSLAGVTAALALMLGGAGVAGAVTVAPAGTHASATTASDNPAPDCHSAEHAGLGMIMNCQSEHKGEPKG